LFWGLRTEEGWWLTGVGWLVLLGVKVCGFGSRAEIYERASLICRIENIQE
jgi:hypothetical protein